MLKTSFNMMFKRIASLLFTVVLLTGLFSAYGADTDEPTETELLLIYDKGLTEEGQLSLQNIVKLLTFMQHSVTFVDEAESLKYIGAYKHVICYDIHSCSDELIEALAKRDVKTFIIGGDILDRYMKAKGYTLKTKFIDQAIYTASYEYKTGEAIEALTDISSVYIINSPVSYTKGTLTSFGEKTALYKGQGDLLYTPIADMMQPISEVAFSNEAAYWLWPYTGSPNTQVQYIIIEGVYPLLSGTAAFENCELP